MSKYLVYLSIITITIIQACAPSTESQIDEMVKPYIDEDMFSGVVLYAEQRQVVYQKAFGFSHLETSTKNSIDTKFNIGSLNKDFTDVLILQLAADSLIKLDDQIGKYVKDLKDNISKQVTIRHLLRHESGLGDYAMHPAFQEDPNKYNTLENLIELVKSESLQFVPGSDHFYSNSGYIILGKIIENVTGLAFADVIQKRIFNPLGMKNTHYSNLDSVTRKATGYIKSATGKTLNARFFEHSATPAGGCYSTMGDLYKFYDALAYTDSLLTDPYKKLLYAHANPNINVSWAAIANDPSFYNAKAGGVEGFNSMVIEWLAKGKLAIVLANYDPPVAEQVGMGIFAIMRDITPIKPQLPAKQYVFQILKEYGYDFVSAKYDSLMDIQNYQYDDPGLLNQAGYDLLRENLNVEAVQVFKLNVKRFPKDANAYDSLGEAYMIIGENDLAVENYTKSLELDPGNKNAIDMIAKLMEKK